MDTLNTARSTDTAMPSIPASEMKLLKVISLLLDYPSNELLTDGSLAACRELVKASTLISPQVRRELVVLIDDLMHSDSLEVQSRYDGLFERGRSLSLWLFEHVHGESRDRGQAMVDLMSQYEQAGFAIGIKELPDYLPMYLEFLAYQAAVTGDDIQARMDIADVSHIIAVLAARLKERDSVYLGCLHALLQIAGKPLTVVDEQLAKIAGEVADDSKEALDKEWEEEAVDFMAAEQQSRCPSQTSSINIAAAQAKTAQQQVDVPVHWVDFDHSRNNNHNNSSRNNSRDTTNHTPQPARQQSIAADGSH